MNYIGCSSGCTTCTSGASTDCTSCISGRYLYLPPKGECRVSCPSGYWYDNTMNQCVLCHQGSSPPYTCATCYLGGSSSCLSCSIGYLFNGTCVDICPPAYYPVSSLKKCQPCHQSTISPFSCAT